MVVAFGIWQIVAAFRRSVDPPVDRSRQPKHGTGRAPDRRTAILMPVAFTGCALAGFGGIWWGIASGHPTIMWFGVVMASVVVAGYPTLFEALRNRVRRR
jgi:hypothetical protein